MRNLSILLLAAIPLISGCVNQEILDDVQLATAVGYNLTEEGNLEITAVVPVYLPDKSIKNETFTATSKLSKETRDKLNKKSPKPFVSGKIEVALYTEKVARIGIIDILDTFQRDPSTGANIYLAVVEGDLKKQLNSQYGDIDNGTYLSDLIEQNIEQGMLPKTNLHQFTKLYYAEGRDPALPYLKLEGKEASIKGVALFKGDKYVDYIKDDDTVILKVLRETFANRAAFSVELDNEGTFASVYNITSNRQIDIKNAMTDPSVTITVNTEAIIREYSGKEELTPEMIKSIEKKMEEDLERRTAEMVKKFQELNIDPIGIGNHVKHQDKSWDKAKWNDLYPQAKIKIDVNVKISESGVIT
jgi:spore germination protein